MSQARRARSRSLDLADKGHDTCSHGTPLGVGRVRARLLGCGRWGAHIPLDLLTLGCDVPVVAHSEASIGRARAGGASEIVSNVHALGDVEGLVVATGASRMENSR
jgi:hypothetical protein